MAKRQRMRRQDPSRTAPIRQFSTVFRRGDETPDRAASASDGVGDAVRMGYSVVEEQIRQGQRAAQRLWGAAPGSSGGSGIGSVADVANRLLRYSTDLAALHFDLMTVLMQSPGFNAVSANSAPPRGAGSRVIIEIESQRKNHVAIDLWPGKLSADLTVPALHSADSDNPPLTEIGFSPATEQSAAILRIAIPSSQPDGVYSGLVLDTETGQPRGTLSVTLDQ